MQCLGDRMSKKDPAVAKYLKHYQRVALAQHELSRERRKTKRAQQLIFSGEKRQFVITKTMELLLAWKSSAFENEGACVHGLRSTLCLQGHAWSLADEEARSIVRAALANMGVIRPTWDQGQREYVNVGTSCARCGKDLPDEDREGIRKGRFCSSECAKAMLQHWDSTHSVRFTALGIAAYRLIEREKRPNLRCEHCGTSYKPRNPFANEQMFCSQTCRAASRKRTETRDCAHCAKPFVPAQKKTIYCSRSCSTAHSFVKNAELLPRRACLSCDGGYQPKHENHNYCSDRCCKRELQRLYRAKQKADKETNVVYLTAEIFDSWFREAA